MRSICAICAVLVLALVAGQAVAAPGGEATASSSSKVTVKSFKYQPGTLQISKGSTVVFSNAAGVAHTATDSGVFNTGHIKPGHSASVRFKQKGTFTYHCTIHPFMHGKIVVG